MKNQTFRPLFFKFSLFLAPLAIIFSLVIYIPKLKTWILHQVQTEAPKHAPLSLKISSISFDLLPLGISFNKVTLTPNDELKPILQTTHISKVSLSVSFLSLLKGQLKIGDINIYNSKVSLNLTPLLDSPSSSKTPLSWSQLKMIPIHQVQLHDISTQIRYKDHTHSLETISAALDLNWKSLFLQISVQKISSPLIGVASPSLQLKTFISPKGFKIHTLHLKHKDSLAALSGSLLGDPLAKENLSKNLKLRTQLNLSDTSEVIRSMKDLDFSLKALGTLYADFELQQSKNEQKPNIDFSLKTTNTQINNIKLGDINTVGSFKKQTLKIPKVELNHPAGQAQINDILLKFAEKITVQGDVAVQDMELRRLLKSLDIKNVPLKLLAHGEMPCYGELHPKISVHCKGFARVPFFHVWADQPQDTIIKAEHLQAIGHVDITDKAVTYKASAKMNEAKGSSQGTISYTKGFNIQYSAHFPHVERITDFAGLEMEGSANISGTTSGNSDFGIIDMNVKTRDFWFENYFVGTAQSKVAYRSGQLFFRKINGFSGVSKYKGNLRVNLLKNKIYADLTSPFLEVKDITRAIQREIPLPVTGNGTGFAKIKLWGPLQLDKLNLNFESSFFRGRIDKENFDECKINLEARKGHLKSKKITIKKLNSLILIDGDVSPSGHLNAKVNGHHLRLEQSEYVKDLNLNVEGNLDFTMLLKGPFLKPDTTLNGKISKLIMGTKKMKDSHFHLILRKHSIEGEANLIGNTIQTNFKFPFNTKDPFSFYLKSQNWNFIHLFDLFSENALKLGFNTNLDSEIQLNAPTGGFWKSSGFIQVNNFLINRDNEFLRSTGVARAVFKEGKISTNNFELKGHDSFLKLTAQEAHREALNFKLNGKLKLNLLALFTPFLSELQGDLSVGMKFSGSPENFSMVGSTYIQNGRVTLDAFPHPFEDLSADLLFGPRNILINSVKAKFGKGPLSAEGTIDFKSLANILIRLDGQFRNVAINVPEGFKTKGSGLFSITGQQPPYKLKINYDVDYGDIEKDLSQISNNQGTTVKPGTFLPKFLTKTNFQPITLDISTNIKKPVNVHFLVARMDIQTPVTGKIRAQGPPDDIKLNGRISSVPEGVILFNSNKFDIQTAIVTYKDAPPEAPELNVQAESRIGTSTDGEEYDVNLLVLGTANQPKVSLQSQPPLSEQEILSLLALGTISDESKLNPGSQRDNESQYKIDSKIIADQLGISREIKDKLGIDFDLSSSYNGDESTTHRFTIRKNFSQNFGIEASRTIEKNPRNEFRAEYRLNSNVSLTGNYNSGQSNSASESLASENQEILGLDIEYKVKFK